MKFKYRDILFLIPLLLASCGHEVPQHPTHQLAIRVRHDTKRSWDAYKTYSWNKDVLLPIDAFSTFVVTGLTDEADEVLNYVIDSIDFDMDFKARVLEVNIRILGGLVSMYQLSGDKRILEKAVDIGDRLLPAFQSKTGIPYLWVNLRTGEASGEQVNAAEAGTYLLEMGMLSYFTGNPAYYEAARSSSRAIFERRSDIGLVGEVIDIHTGEWVNTTSHICAGSDSYFEYLYKGWLLFGDPELKAMWDESINAVLKYIPEEKDGRIWYGRVDMHSGERISSKMTLCDAFMPALLAVSGHMEEASELQVTLDGLWDKHLIEPMIYDYNTDSILNPKYILDSEIIESAWYLWELTGDQKYIEMLGKYYKDMVIKENGHNMAIYFLAETLKYLYLAFANQDMYNLESIVFSAKAHPFLKAALYPEVVMEHLNIQ